MLSRSSRLVSAESIRVLRRLWVDLAPRQLVREAASALDRAHNCKPDQLVIPIGFDDPDGLLDQVLSTKSYRIGIDVGGTFTKAALIDNMDGSVVGRSSVHTTHDHPDGVAAGVIQVFEQVLSDAGVDAGDVVLLAHSTTQATNALLEGDVARVGILGLAGAKAAKLAQAQVCIDPIELAPGRVLHTCNQFLLSDTLDRKAVEDAVGALRSDGAQVLVASAAFGVDNTTTEELVREVGEEFGLPTTCGHEVTRLYGLTTRTRTAVINASILPRMIATANLTETSMKNAGIDAPLMIMRGDDDAVGTSGQRGRLVDACRHVRRHLLRSRRHLDQSRRRQGRTSDRDLRERRRPRYVREFTRRARLGRGRWQPDQDHRRLGARRRTEKRPYRR